MQVALLSNGRVQEVWPSREIMAGNYHPDFIAALIDVPDNVQAGYWQTENGFSATRPASLEEDE